MYAKLTDGIFRPAPRRLVIGDWQVFNPTDAQYLEKGYKRVRFTDPPEAPEGFCAESGWAETEAEIVQTWTLESAVGEQDG